MFFFFVFFFVLQIHALQCFRVWYDNFINQIVNFRAAKFTF